MLLVVIEKNKPVQSVRKNCKAYYNYLNTHLEIFHNQNFLVKISIEWLHYGVNKPYRIVQYIQF